MNLASYLEQFRGDEADIPTIQYSNDALFSPGRAELMKICEDRGGHDWHGLYGGVRCVNCGAQIAFHADIPVQEWLDSELRAGE